MAKLIKRIELTHTHDGHNKFYKIDVIEGARFSDWGSRVDNYKVDTYWGKIGTAGQVKTYTFTTLGKATAFADDIVREKVSKGYELGLVDLAEEEVEDTVETGVEEEGSGAKLVRMKAEEAKSKEKKAETNNAEVSVHDGYIIIN